MKARPLEKAWLCCICMSQVSAFDTALLHRVETTLPWHKPPQAPPWRGKERTHVFLFMTINKTNEQ